MSAESGEPVKKLVVVRSGWNVRWRLQNWAVTYSRGTGEGLQLPPAHSQAAMARMFATCANGLKRFSERTWAASVKKGDAQQDSQQLATLPMLSRIEGEEEGRRMDRGGGQEKSSSN